MVLAVRDRPVSVQCRSRELVALFSLGHGLELWISGPPLCPHCPRVGLNPLWLHLILPMLAD